MSHRLTGGNSKNLWEEAYRETRFALTLINTVAMKSCKAYVMTITLLAVIALLNASMVIAQNDSL